MRDSFLETGYCNDPDHHRTTWVIADRIAAKALATEVAGMDQNEVLQKLIRAVQKFMERDMELLARDVDERSITHRLAMYLQRQFPEMDVDCEYNRYDYESKWIDFYPPYTNTYDTEARTVFPDIIVHKRGPKGPNLLVIEAKKSKNQDAGLDMAKLKAYKSNEHLKYEHAVFLVFRTGDNPGVEAPKFI